MSGGLESPYLRARTALLDAADALTGQLDALVLVGAQAIYLHTGRAESATRTRWMSCVCCRSRRPPRSRPV